MACTAPSPDLLQVLDATARHHRVAVAGITVHWRAWGQGQPLVLLHGGHGAWGHWVRNIARLAAHYRVLVPDLPGFGDSDDFPLPPHDPSRLDATLQALTDSMDQLAPQQPWHLVGFSFGGAVAGLLAARCPRVQRLVLLGTAGHGGTRRETVPLLDWRVPEPAARAQALHQNLSVFMLSQPDAVDAQALHIHEAACMATRFRSKALSRSSVLRTALENYERPVLLVWGEADVTAVPMEAAECLQQGRPERDWTIVPRAGHWVQYESAEAVNTLVLGWLGA